MYKAVIDALIRFQSVDPSHCEPLHSWVFDVQTLLWETRYFLERFVKGFLNLSVKKEGHLEEEFLDLAERVNQYPKRVMHRDFQSCNIMIPSGEIYFIDYQGARMGPPAYDLVSLVFDPYCELSEALENELCRYYLDGFSRTAPYDAAALNDSLLYCGLQRHMQALGAYGFLSRIKGKTWFEAHIPRGVRLLKREVDRVDEEFPVLSDLVDKIAKLVNT
jgi:aminoglycoside/choline kinase family phosphotransferase